MNTRRRAENAGLIAPARTHRELMVWEALNLALDRALAQDEAVFVLGEDVGLYGGSYRVTQGLYAKYGEWPVRDTPIPEGSFTGLGVGAALIGGRPVVEIMTVNFAFLALDAVINMAAKLRYMSGGQFRVPLVVRMPGGVARQLAAQHSQRIEHTLMNVPGLRIVAPGTPQDAYWQLTQAIAADDPVIVLEHDCFISRKGRSTSSRASADAPPRCAAKPDHAHRLAAHGDPVPGGGRDACPRGVQAGKACAACGRSTCRCSRLRSPRPTACWWSRRTVFAGAGAEIAAA